MNIQDTINEIETTNASILALESQISALRDKSAKDCEDLWPVVANLGRGGGLDRQFACGGVHYSLSVDRRLTRIHDLPVLDGTQVIPQAEAT